MGDEGESAKYEGPNTPKKQKLYMWHNLNKDYATTKRAIHTNNLR
jgi:hypothetical protein